MTIQAAAERLLTERHYDYWESNRNPGAIDDAEVVGTFAKRLTDETAADAGKLGFQEVSDGHSLYDEYGDEVVAVRGGGLWVYGTEVPANDPPTMGQLRCLCLGLNITLTEQPNG